MDAADNLLSPCNAMADARGGSTEWLEKCVNAEPNICIVVDTLDGFEKPFVDKEIQIERPRYD